MVNRNPFVNNKNQLTTLGTIIFTIIFLVFAVGSGYLIYWLLKTTKQETKTLAHSKRLKEKFNDQGIYLEDSSQYFDDGYYNVKINDKLMGLTGTQNNQLRLLDINSSDDEDNIFFITKLNNKNSEKKLYYVIPLIRAGGIYVNTNNKIDLMNNSFPAFKEDESIENGIEIDHLGPITRISKGENYLTKRANNDEIILAPLDEQDEMAQTVEFIAKNTVSNYHHYENGLYTLITEDDKTYIIRIEGVLGKLNTYNILELIKNSNDNNFGENRIVLDKDNFKGFLNSQESFLDKQKESNQFFIQPGSISQGNKDIVFLVRRNTPSNPYSRRCRLIKYTNYSGLTNGYYFFSVKVGNNYKLLTHENNEIVINTETNNLSTDENLINLIKNSMGNNIFLIKNTSENFHSIQVANEELEFNIENNDSGVYKLIIQKNEGVINPLKINKEHNNSYTFNFDIPHPVNERSPNYRKTLYLQNIQNKLVAPSTSDTYYSNNIQFYLHYIAPENTPKTKPSQNVECAFYSRFLKLESNNYTRIYSVNDSENLYKESEFRNLFIKECNTSEKYIPEFIEENNLTNFHSYKPHMYSDNFEKNPQFVTIENNQSIKNIENSTIYDCKNTCEMDNSCKTFLFEQQNNSEAYLGDCKIIDINNISKIKDYNNDLSTGKKYTAYNKINKVLGILPTEEQKVKIKDTVINKADESCSIRGSYICEDKEYCVLKGNNCLRKCALNSFNKTSKNLDFMDHDGRCVGSLNDFDILFQEINRDFDLNSITNSITIKLKDIKLINISKNIHHPILKYNNGFTVQFKCIGNNALDTDFELPIDYKLENDDYKVDNVQSRLILGDKVDEVNIQVPQEIVECSAKGYTLILKIKLTDIYDQSKIVDVLPLDKDNKIVYDVNNKINNQDYYNKIILGKSIYNVVDSKIDNFNKI